MIPILMLALKVLLVWFLLAALVLALFCWFFSTLEVDDYIPFGEWEDDEEDEWWKGTQ